jgi:hypothetical protein
MLEAVTYSPCLIAMQSDIQAIRTYNCLYDELHSDTTISLSEGVLHSGPERIPVATHFDTRVQGT